jgi:type IV pilus assembly protein PilC
MWIVIFVTIIKIINSTYLWKIFFAAFFTKLPIFGYIVKQSNVIYFIKAFTLLQNSWVLLLDTLKTSSRVVPNLLYKKELIRVKNEVEVGLTISKALWLNLEYETSIYTNKLFSEEFAYVVSTGEETWSLSKSLAKVWVSYNKELKRYIWNLSSMMEPIIIVIVWFLVWVIVIAIMLPFFELGKVAKEL